MRNMHHVSQGSTYRAESANVPRGHDPRLSVRGACRDRTVMAGARACRDCAVVRNNTYDGRSRRHHGDRMPATGKPISARSRCSDAVGRADGDDLITVIGIRHAPAPAAHPLRSDHRDRRRDCGRPPPEDGGWDHGDHTARERRATRRSLRSITVIGPSGETPGDRLITVLGGGDHRDQMVAGSFS